MYTIRIGGSLMENLKGPWKRQRLFGFPVMTPVLNAS
jgi:hypothetical protein